MAGITRFTAILFFVLISSTVISQITYPIDDYDGELIEACSGFFVDSGGDTLSVYQPGEDYSITFCSSDENLPYLKFSFDFFQLREGDILYVYDGEDDESALLFEAQNDDLHDTVIWFSTNCAHFRFISLEDDEDDNGDNDNGGKDLNGDDDRMGWQAEISCYEFCEGIWLKAETTTSRFQYCPYDPNVDFIASAGYNAENADYESDNFVFTWKFNEDIFEGETASYDFEEPGAYPFSLEVEDIEFRCYADVINVVQIGTIPSLTGTHVSPDTICERDQARLDGVAEAETWTGFPTSVEGVFAIPDGTGEAFESSLDFDVFPPLSELESEEDFGRVCINIEHVDYGQLRFVLECPNGNSVILSDYSDGGANLGEPVVWNTDVPGTGYDYCFSPNAPLGHMYETSTEYHEYTDNAGNWYHNAPFLPPGTFTPEESFEELTGCPLNGEWTLRVWDNEADDKNGHIFEWSLFFNEELYPDSLIFTPNIVEETWYDGDDPLDDNLVSKNEAGEYEFRFEVEDDFGCVYDTIVFLEVLPLPSAEIISELELPVCEGDSTLFTVVPVDDDPYHWAFQWEIDMTPIEGSIYDTIMAKELANYSVLITDTITGCSEFLEKRLEDQNCDLEIPNVFTPNNDGINDEFVIKNLEHYPNSRIVIYNRNGKKVFEHHNYDGNWWDGRGAPDGTYFYVLFYERMGEKRQIHGTVSIVR